VERVGIIGAGRLGSALARALAVVGWPVVAVASRRAASAQALVARLPAARVATAQEVADIAELVVLTVPDAAIGEAARAVHWHAGQAVVHTSGAASLAPLAPARAAGALVGALHPLQTFASREEPAPLALFAGITCALEGDPALLPRLSALVRALGARPLVLPPEARARYHAAAVLAANYVVTLLHLATDLWATFGVGEREATAALLPLVRRAVDNVAAHGPATALTGPIARGDAATVAQHIAALAAARPTTLEAYIALAEATLTLAAARGDLPPERAAAVRATLEAAARASRAPASGPAALH
jgi:predicted short-subunit dehydrogenase-like oxidoreductase (DUF2520 family)